MILTGGGGARLFLWDLTVLTLLSEPLDITDWGRITEMSSFTVSKELAEPVIVEFIGGIITDPLGGLGADDFFFFFLVGAGGGVMVTVSGAFFCLPRNPFMNVFGLAPVLGAVEGADMVTGHVPRGLLTKYLKHKSVCYLNT